MVWITFNAWPEHAMQVDNARITGSHSLPQSTALILFIFSIQCALLCSGNQTHYYYLFLHYHLLSKNNDRCDWSLELLLLLLLFVLFLSAFYLFVDRCQNATKESKKCCQCRDNLPNENDKDPKQNEARNGIDGEFYILQTK